MKEVKAKTDDPVWRRDEESGAPYALKLTAAGAKAIVADEGAEPENADNEGGALENHSQLAVPSGLGFPVSISSRRESSRSTRWMASNKACVLAIEPVASVAG